MGMVFCRACGKEIHDTAPLCPFCGAIQNSAEESINKLPTGNVRMSSISLFIGVLCTLMFFDESSWDKDTIAGLMIFALTGFAFGALSLGARSKGKGIAIFGVLLCVISLLAAINLAFK